MGQANVPNDANGDVRARDELIARAGHDLRTPLAAVLTWLQVLRAEVAGDQTSRAVGMAERAARELGQIVSGFEDAHRLMTGTLTVQQLPVDLVAVVHSAVEAVVPAAEARGLSLECATPHSRALLKGDDHRLNHSLNRLVSAAVVLTPPGGQIRVSLESRASEARVRVRCVGLRLEPALRQALVAGPEWPSLTGPTGQLALDFAVACRTVALHGGQLEAESLTGDEGTEISVSLPLSHAESSSLSA